MSATKAPISLMNMVFAFNYRAVMYSVTFKTEQKLVAVYPAHVGYYITAYPAQVGLLACYHVHDTRRVITSLCTLHKVGY